MLRRREVHDLLRAPEVLDTVAHYAYTARHPSLSVQPDNPTQRRFLMYSKPMISLDQVQRAMAAMLEKATQQPNQPVAIAIVDDGGNMLSYARMDRCRAIPQRMAVRKAYTAALSGQDTLAYAERLKSHGRTVAEMGDPNLAAVQGGLVVLHAETGVIMGGIGVSGLTAQEDEDIARLGLLGAGTLVVDQMCFGGCLPIPSRQRHPTEYQSSGTSSHKNLIVGRPPGGTQF